MEIFWNIGSLGLGLQDILLTKHRMLIFRVLVLLILTVIMSFLKCKGLFVLLLIFLLYLTGLQILATITEFNKIP